MTCIVGAPPVSLGTKCFWAHQPHPMASTKSSLSEGLSGHQSLLCRLKGQARRGWQLITPLPGKPSTTNR